MNSIINFRESTWDDLPLIVEIYNSTVAGRMVTADIEEVSIESRKEWFSSFNSSSRPLWIIENDNKPVGWLGFHSFYGRPAYNSTVEISLYLHEKSRGKGLGQRCLIKAIEKAPQYQIKTLLAFIFGHNLPSMNLFIKQGFEQYGNLPEVAVLDGISRDLIILGKKI